MKDSVSRSYEATKTGANNIIAMQGIRCLPASLSSHSDRQAVREMLSRIDNEALQFVPVSATDTHTGPGYAPRAPETRDKRYVYTYPSVSH